MMISKETLDVALEAIGLAKNAIGLLNSGAQVKLDEAAKELVDYRKDNYPEKEEPEQGSSDF